MSQEEIKTRYAALIEQHFGELKWNSPVGIIMAEMAALLDIYTALLEPDKPREITPQNPLILAKLEGFEFENKEQVQAAYQVLFAEYAKLYPETARVPHKGYVLNAEGIEPVGKASGKGH